MVQLLTGEVFFGENNLCCDVAFICYLQSFFWASNNEFACYKLPGVKDRKVLIILIEWLLVLHSKDA